MKVIKISVEFEVPEIVEVWTLLTVKVSVGM